MILRQLQMMMMMCADLTSNEDYVMTALNMVLFFGVIHILVLIFLKFKKG
jgi:hypothetical protein